MSTMIEVLNRESVTPEVKEATIIAFGRLAPYVAKEVTHKDGKYQIYTP